MPESPNLPAVRTEPPTAVVARRDTDSWADQLPAIVELSRSICGTDFVPEAMRDNVAATAAAILYGREVNLPPMTALGNVNVIKGKPGLSAVIMRAQVLAAGHEIRQDASDSSRCVLSGRRRGTDYWQTVTYTIDDARQAGLIKRGKNGDPSMYEKNPRRMLRARATSELCELMFADVVRGMPSLEELEELDDETPAGPPAKTTRATVQRKSRAKTDDGTVPPADPSTAGGPAAAPSSPPLPPLPGEDGYDDTRDGAVDGEPAPAEGSRTAGPAETDDGAGASTATPSPAGEATSPPAPSSPTITAEQTKKLAAGMSKAGITTKQDALDYVMSVIQCDVASRDELTGDEADQVIAALEQLIRAESLPAPAGEEDLPPEVEPEDRPRMITRGVQKGMFKTFGDLGITDDAERLRITAAIVGRTPVDHATGQPSSNGMTMAEAQTLVDALAKCKTRDHVEALVEMVEQQRAAAAEAGDQDA